MKHIKNIHNILNAVIFLSALIIFLVLILKITAEPVIENVRFSTVIKDSKSRLLRMTLSEDGSYRIYKPIEEISPYMKDITLLYEDEYFYYHFGINLVSAFKAAVSFMQDNDYKAGASTISMQLARMKYNINSKSVLGKLNQMFHSVLLEIKYSKKDILEAYLNLAPYGYNIEGAEAASMIYYNTPSKDLTLFESISLVIIPQNPNKKAPTINEGKQAGIKSRKIILPKWLKKHPEDKHIADLVDMDIYARKPSELPFKAPHFTDYLLSRGLRGEINTTLNLTIQQLIESDISQYIMNKSIYGINNAAVLLLDYTTMEVKAYAGSSNYFNDEIYGQVNGIESMRSPGSVLKPFLFALSIDNGLIHPKSLMKDSPRQYGAYSPENSDRGFMGPIFAEDALIHSRNIPAIELLLKLPKSSFYDLLYYSGVEKLQSEKYYGTALAIGGFEVTMENIAKMYAGLANFGEEKCINYLTDLKCEEDSYKMFSKEAAFLVMDMLSYNTPLNSIFENDFIPWKTGTSYAFRDAWSAGIMGPYILVVWVGNFDGSGNNAFLGRQAAGELFFNIASSLKYTQNIEFTRPLSKNSLNIKEVDICSPTGDLPNKFCPKIEKGYFIPGVSPIKVTDVYREIPIDKKTGLRACYYNKDTTELKVYEFWPSDINKLFKQSGIQKRQPPKYLPGCKIDMLSNTGHEPVIILPDKDTVINITQDKREIAFKVTTESDAELLYYFIDNMYIGKEETGNTFFWQANTGSHILTVTDNLGRSSSVNFKVDIINY